MAETNEAASEIISDALDGTIGVVGSILEGTAEAAGEILGSIFDD